MRTTIIAILAAPLVFGSAFAGGIAIGGTRYPADGRPAMARPLAELVAVSDDTLTRVDKEDWVESAIGFYGHALAEALVIPSNRPVDAAAATFDDAQRCAYTLMSPRIADPILLAMRHDMVGNDAEQRAYLRLLDAVAARPAIDPATAPCAT